MTLASKCDRCGDLFENEAGTMSIAYGITTAVDDEGSATQDSWEVDLCAPCSQEFRDFIRHKAT